MTILQYKLWVSLILWNHNNGEDCWLGNGPEDRVAVQGVLYQGIFNLKLTGRKKLGRKMCTSNRDDRKLENTVNQSRFKHLGELHKEWTEAGVHQEPPHLDIFRKGPSHFWTWNNVRSILPGLKRKRTGLLLHGPKSSFQMKVHFAFHLEIKVWRKSEEAQNPCCLKSSVKFPQSVMIWAAMSSAGVGPLCFLKSSQRSHLPEHFRALHASFCWQALWRCWFHFPTGLGICPHCQRYQKLVQWPWCYCAWLANNLAWPEPHREWSIIPEQCHRLIASMPRHIDAVIHAKGGPTKYWVHRNEHTLQKPDISV